MKSNTQHQKKQSTHVCIWTHGSNKLQFLFQKHVPAVVAATAFWMESCWRSLGETCALGVLKLSFCLCLVFFGTNFTNLKDRKNFGQESTTLCHIIIIFSTFAVFPQGTQLQTHNCTSPKMAQHRLFVGGLPWLTDERQFLNQCLQYVRLPPLQLKVHRKPEQQFSFAFITLQSAEDMALLQQALHLKKMQGCYVTCCVAQDKGWRPPWQPAPKVVPPPKRLKTEGADQT